MREKYELKDLMTVAIFVVIYFAAFFLGMCFGYIPLLMSILPLIVGIICGIPFMLFLSKVKKPGMLFLFGVLCGLLSLGMGGGLWPLLTAAAASLLAEGMMRGLRYVPTVKMVLVHAVFSLWYTGYSLRLYLASFGSYRAFLVERYGEEYVAAMLQNVSRAGFWGGVVMSLVGGALGGLLGCAVLKRHFQHLRSKG